MYALLCRLDAHYPSAGTGFLGCFCSRSSTSVIGGNIGVPLLDRGTPILGELTILHAFKLSGNSCIKARILFL